MKKTLFVLIAFVLLVGCKPATVSAPEIPNMVYIPGGEFQMGCDPAHNGGFSCPADELPLHKVSLDGFYIDKYEVTAAQYAECVAADGCQFPTNTSSETRESYFGEDEFANYPVIYVSWQNAADFCTWAGKRLPTEAEWELAARGTKSNTYAWGDKEPTCSLANGDGCVGDTNAVGSQPDGASVYGVMDMTGNVWEWVNDWYSETYYTESPAQNPAGPDGSTNKVLRGGSWASKWVFLRASGRAYDPDFNSSNDVGFRCAKTSDVK